MGGNGARAVWLLCAGGLLAVLPTAAPASAWCRMTTAASMPGMCTTEGIPLEWRRRCIEYAIDARGSKDLTLDQVTEIVHDSFRTWLSVTCDDEFPGFDVREASRNSLCDRAEYHTDAGNVNTIAFVSAWEDRGYDDRAYALTTVWHNTRSGEIYDADVEVNEQRGTYGICPAVDGCDDGTIDLQNVMTHELGHFFGLGHTDDANATMYETSRAGETGKRVLRADDVEGFCAVYPPGTLPESCSFTPRHGADLNCEDDEGCGCSAPGAPRRGDAWLALLLTPLLLLLRRRPVRGL